MFLRSTVALIPRNCRNISSRLIYYSTKKVPSEGPVDPISLSGLGESGGSSSELSAEDLQKQVREELSKAVADNVALQEKVKDFEDRYLRSLAESENMRNRLTKQINDSKLYGIQKFCKDLTEIEDVLQMAIESVPKSEITDSNKHLKQLYEGLTMTEARMLQVFKSHGLTQINPLNSKFDPNEHEAVAQQEAEGKESGTIIFVSKLGYKLHDRVIRPAVVGVAK